MISRKYNAKDSLKSMESSASSGMETGTERFQRTCTWVDERMVVMIIEKKKAQLEEQVWGTIW